MADSEIGAGAVEKERVPKVSSQQSRGGMKAAEHGETERPQNVGKFEMQREEGEEDIAKYRQAAQQNSIDVLRAAEERYNKAKKVTSEKSAQAKHTLKQGAEKTPHYAAEKGAQTRDALMQGAQRTSQYAGDKGQPLYETTRDTLAGAGNTAVDYTGQAKDYAAEKAVGAKDVVAETGKGTAGYVGSVATTVKDKAVVAGWGAGEYTAEKVADATKAVANVTAGAAGYVGETAVATKDRVGSAGVSAKDYAAQKLAAAKDAVVATQESAKDYAARKRAEAETEMLAKQSAEAKGDVWSRPTEERHGDIAGAGRQTVEAAKETISKPVEKVGGFLQEQPEYGMEGQQGGAAEAGGGDGGVLHAIGETVLEIGQTTKDLLVGKGQTQSTVKDPADLNK